MSSSACENQTQVEANASTDGAEETATGYAAQKQNKKEEQGENAGGKVEDGGREKEGSTNREGQTPIQELESKPSHNKNDGEDSCGGLEAQHGDGDRGGLEAKDGKGGCGGLEAESGDGDRGGLEAKDGDSGSQTQKNSHE